MVVEDAAAVAWCSNRVWAAVVAAASAVVVLAAAASEEVAAALAAAGQAALGKGGFDKGMLGSDIR